MNNKRVIKGRRPFLDKRRSIEKLYFNNLTNNTSQYGLQELPFEMHKTSHKFQKGIHFIFITIYMRFLVIYQLLLFVGYKTLKK